MIFVSLAFLVIKKWYIIYLSFSKNLRVIALGLTEGTEAPLTVTSSANLTLEGFFFNLSFLAAVNSADFLADCNIK